MTTATITHKPYFWSIEAWPSELKGFFLEPSPLGIPSPGHYIILQTPLTSESWVRKKIYDLLSHGITYIEVVKLNEPLQEFASDPEGVHIFLGLALGIDESLIGPESFGEWEDSLLDEPLSLREAIEYAELVIHKVEPQDQLRASISLDGLRRRAKVSEYSWDKKYLAQIRAKLEKVFSLSGEADPDERLRLDILALIKETDPVKRTRKRAKLCSNYSISKGDIEFLCQTLDESIKTSEPKVHDLADFLSMETEGIDYLIPGLLPRGETVLLAGPPKAGKTQLAIDAGFCVATGEAHFLGEIVQQGKVLFVSTDQSGQSDRIKLLKRGFRPSDRENFRPLTGWNITKMDALEQQLEDFQPDLVIIDSIKGITVGHEVSENSSQFADILYKLKDLTGRYGAASILIHHTNKDKEAAGLGKVRGSTAITGACWGVWVMDYLLQTTDKNGKPLKKPKFDPANPKRTLSAICRDSEGQSFTIELNLENHSYGVSGEEIQVREKKKTQEQLIIDLLSRYHPKGLTGREIMEQLGMGRSIYSVLNRMLERRTVTHRQSKIDRRMMVYCLPKTKTTPSLGQSDSECDLNSPEAIHLEEYGRNKIRSHPEKLDYTPNYTPDGEQSCDQSSKLVASSNTEKSDHKNDPGLMGGVRKGGWKEVNASQLSHSSDTLLSEGKQLDEHSVGEQSGVEKENTATASEEIISTLNYLQSQDKLSLLVNKYGQEEIDNLSLWVEPVSQKLKIQKWLRG
ncbi:MAG: AAA family ATPase [Coleofasciculaceae cyanobacterium]